METFSALLAFCAGKSPVPGEFPSQRPVTRSFDVFFYLCLNKHVSKQSWGWWFKTPSLSLLRHCNVVALSQNTCFPSIMTMSELAKSKLMIQMLLEMIPPLTNNCAKYTFVEFICMLCDSKTYTYFGCVICGMVLVNFNHIIQGYFSLICKHNNAWLSHFHINPEEYE